MLFLLITDKRGALLRIRAVASRRSESTREGNFWSVFERLLANSPSHTFFWKIVKHDSRPEASLLGRCSWKIFKKGGQEAGKKTGILSLDYFFLTGNLQEQSKKRPVFQNKTSASNTLAFQLPPLSTQLELKVGHTGHCLSIQHTRDQRTDFTMKD